MVQEKKAEKAEKLKQEEKYMWAVLDGVKEKVSFHHSFLIVPKPVFLTQTFVYFLGW